MPVENSFPEESSSKSLSNTFVNNSCEKSTESLFFPHCFHTPQDDSFFCYWKISWVMGTDLWGVCVS